MTTPCLLICLFLFEYTENTSCENTPFWNDSGITFTCDSLLTDCSAPLTKANCCYCKVECCGRCQVPTKMTLYDHQHNPCEGMKLLQVSNRGDSPASRLFARATNDPNALIYDLIWLVVAVILVTMAWLYKNWKEEDLKKIRQEKEAKAQVEAAELKTADDVEKPDEI